MKGQGLQSRGACWDACAKLSYRLNETPQVQVPSPWQLGKFHGVTERQTTVAIAVTKSCQDSCWHCVALTCSGEGGGPSWALMWVLCGCDHGLVPGGLWLSPGLGRRGAQRHIYVERFWIQVQSKARRSNTLTWNRLGFEMDQVSSLDIQPTNVAHFVSLDVSWGLRLEMKSDGWRAVLLQILWEGHG